MEESINKPLICSRILKWKDLFIYDAPNVISMERYRIWKEQAPIRKQMEQEEFMKMLRDWHS